ncbi:MAG: sigma-70 family RNA polymerase sigma factor [Chitinivibrionales bacterium]|nr:sigma-70 family RNA polymerase sigma factor [Chitinivibrionales bacterium]
MHRPGSERRCHENPHDAGLIGSHTTLPWRMMSLPHSSPVPIHKIAHLGPTRTENAPCRLWRNNGRPRRQVRPDGVRRARCVFLGCMPAKLSDSNEWVDQYGDLLYSYARMRVRDDRTAQDLVQETFLAALRSRDSFAGSSSEETWLVGILKHKILDHYRRSNRGINRDLEYVERPDELFDATGHWVDPPGPWPAPDTQVRTREFTRVLNECLDRLPDNHRAAFTLRELEERDTEEICNLLAVRSMNLRVMLHRARMRLRRCLEHNWTKESKGGR